jgi:hypothetical protein
MPAAQHMDTVLDTEQRSAEEVSNMLAWTIRVLLIPVFAVLMFWAFSSIAIWASGGTPLEGHAAPVVVPSLAGHTAPVVVPSPERPCEAPDAPHPGRPCVALTRSPRIAQGLSTTHARIR